MPSFNATSVEVIFASADVAAAADDATADEWTAIRKSVKNIIINIILLIWSYGIRNIVEV